MSDAWYIKRSPQNQGPLTFEQLRSLAASGQLALTDRVGHKGMAKWAKAQSVAGLFPQQAEEVAAVVVVEETALDAATVEPPPALVAPAASSAKSNAAPWILAGIAGGGVLVLGCSGLLCTGLALFVMQSGDSEATSLEPGAFDSVPVGELASQPLVSESPAATYTEPETRQPASEPPVYFPPTPAISPEIAAVISKTDAGDTEAMYEMSFRYLEGDGVTADDALALSWLTKAAEAGHADAMNDLAYRYVKGEGIAESPEWAAHWFGKGAEAGSSMAMYNYAICHGNGIGVPQNDYLCRLWVMKSAESGYEPAQKYVEEMKAQLAANAIGLVLGSLFGGGDDDGGGGDTSAADADREAWNARRRSQEYWEDRANRAAAAGNEMDYNYSRSNIP